MFTVSITNVKLICKGGGGGSAKIGIDFQSLSNSSFVDPKYDLMHIWSK